MKFCSKSLLGFFIIIPKFKHWLRSQIQRHPADKRNVLQRPPSATRSTITTSTPPINPGPKNSVSIGSRNSGLNALHYQTRFIHMVCVFVRIVVRIGSLYLPKHDR